VGEVFTAVAVMVKSPASAVGAIDAHDLAGYAPALANNLSAT
jgi:hypothetical protein